MSPDGSLLASCSNDQVKERERGGRKEKGVKKGGREGEREMEEGREREREKKREGEGRGGRE